MIIFVWSSKYPLMAGTGGSENYTIGHVRELNKRGLKTKIVTVGLGKNDGRDEFPDINFHSIDNVKELEDMDATIIFISEALPIKTKKQSYVILHCPPSDNGKGVQYIIDSMKDKQPIVTSHHAAKVWSEVLDIPAGDIPVVYPFADPQFSLVKPTRNKKIRVLFAGRLTPDKGIYTLMWVLHSKKLDLHKMSFTATNAGAHTPDGKVIHRLLKSHPIIRIIKARKTPHTMARLLANTDIVVMPSSQAWWDEMFGILSVEAQHAGCRVVASNSGGIPETDCGGLLLVKPDNPRALEDGMLRAISLGRLSRSERNYASEKFSIKESVDKLLNVINY